MADSTRQRRHVDSSSTFQSPPQALWMLAPRITRVPSVHPPGHAPGPTGPEQDVSSRAARLARGAPPPARCAPPRPSAPSIRRPRASQQTSRPRALAADPRGAPLGLIGRRLAPVQAPSLKGRPAAFSPAGRRGGGGRGRGETCGGSWMPALDPRTRACPAIEGGASALLQRNAVLPILGETCKRLSRVNHGETAPQCSQPPTPVHPPNRSPPLIAPPPPCLSQLHPTRQKHHQSSEKLPRKS